jgi:hypothetical protein
MQRLRTPRFHENESWTMINDLALMLHLCERAEIPSSFGERELSDKKCDTVLESNTGRDILGGK